MKKTLQAVSIIILLLATTVTSKGQSSGLFPELSAFKDQAETKFTRVMHNGNSADKEQVYTLYEDLRMSMNKLISRLITDLKLYDGIIGNRTLRKLKKMDRELMERGIQINGKGYEGRLKVYLDLFDDIQQKSLALANYTNTKSLAAPDIADVKANLEFVLTLLDKVREANKNKSEALIKELENLRLEKPVLK